jgi:secreted PhoX family phosphatase
MNDYDDRRDHGSVADRELARIETREGLDIDMDEPQRRWSASPTFQEVAMSRRSVLQGGVALAVTGILGSGSSKAGSGHKHSWSGNDSSLGFTAIPSSAADTVVVPPGYSYQVILPMGTPIAGTYPPYSIDNTGAEMGMQIGSHHDGMHFFPLPADARERWDDHDRHRGHGHDPHGKGHDRHGKGHDYPDHGRGGKPSSRDGLLVMNHEYIETRLLHRAAVGQPLGAFDLTFDASGVQREADHVLKEMNAHGVSIVRVRRNHHGEWERVKDPRNRRVTALTPMQIGGPMRGHDLVKTKYSPKGHRTRGTFNNCSHGVTPWGTYLACEENFWFYFTSSDPVETRPASINRYAVGAINFWRWNTANNGADEYIRFDFTRTGASARDDYRNEPHCFGWVVEIDPFDPRSTPVKRTHLGRFSHEGCIFGPAKAAKPIVVYSGDDTTNGYIYKFVSRRKYQPGKTDGSILDEGTLYAARFNEDGSGDWLALAPNRNGLTAEAGFPDLPSILVNARGAADIAGATPMDRPEWGAVDHTTGNVYFTLTNNSGRTTVNAANPRPRNVYGHIIRWEEKDCDHTATRFTWDIFALGGNPGAATDVDPGSDPNGQPLTDDNKFGSPDGLWADPDGRLWIQTDAADNSLRDPAYEGIGNNQMLAADPKTGQIRRFLTGPVGCEISGCIMTPDQRTLFVNVQHPGAATLPADFAAGNHSSHFPDGGNSPPRSATLVITKDDGGKIGT